MHRHRIDPAVEENGNAAADNPAMPQPSWEHYILVVEDDHALRDLYRASLREAGYAVIGVEDGVEALKVAQIGKPRAVVLDLGLPRLSGRKVSELLRAVPATRDVPVIVVTGSDTSDLDPSQFACVLKKPINPDDLIDEVQKCLTDRRRVVSRAEALTNGVRTGYVDGKDAAR
jgi:CheY-like chemotaxis protein